MIKIDRVIGEEIIDSRGNPTVSATVVLSDGSVGVGVSPSGASTGKFEAHELRDGDMSRYGGKGVLKAVKNINELISPQLNKLSYASLNLADNVMINLDGTENKEKLGANATLAVSMALAKALSNHYRLPLFRYLGGISAIEMPVPMMNILNGGAHASNNIDIQEFMIIPQGAANFREGLRCCVEVYSSLSSILKSRGSSTAVGDEGGFAPDLASDEEALEVIISAIEKAGYDTNSVKLALDAAGSEWETDHGYLLPKRNKYYTSDELVSYWRDLVGKYPIISLEDPLGEMDWNGFTNLTGQIGSKVQIVGDDLFVTNKKKLKQGIDLKAGNAILVKPNQIGTITETLETIFMAKKFGYKTIISHRSGETEDTFIADLAVAVNAGQIKTGAPCRSERVAKYNRLLKIMEIK